MNQFSVKYSRTPNLFAYVLGAFILAVVSASSAPVQAQITHLCAADPSASKYDAGCRLLLSHFVQGEVLVGFGDIKPQFSEGQTVASRGVTYLTESRARVSAPADGTVEYAGTVPGLGRVVIINAGENYRIVLTGLGHLSVSKGQHVLAHDVLGSMPEAGLQNTALYLELRRGEEPIDPFANLFETTAIAMR